MTKLFKLASEQLSQQHHYDFGMRAVKAILTMAGNLKRQYPDSDEDLLIIRAMKDVNVPKFLRDDIFLFEAIIGDLFPGRKMVKDIDMTLKKGFQKKMQELKLTEGDAFMLKCMELHDICSIRFGNMIVGAPMSGKTEILNVVHQTYVDLFNDLGPKSGYLDVELIVINPKSITMGELYGDTNPITNEFTNGLASNIMSDFVKNESAVRKVIMFDGPVDSLWIENLNSVLDDSMVLCLSNGKRIKLNWDIRLLFEVQDLSQASLATISRVGMVYLDKEVVNESALAKKKLQEIIEEIGLPHKLNEVLINRIEISFFKSLNYIRKNGVEAIPTINQN